MSKKIYAHFFFWVFLLLGTIVTAQNPTLQKELVVLESTHNFDLNPHTANYSNEAQLLTALYEGLFVYNPATLEAEPALAQGYKISRDKKIWTFTLRENATFSDNTPITAYDVTRSWETLCKPGNYAPFASLLDCIEGMNQYRQGLIPFSQVGITSKNANTIVVKLTAPAEHFSKILCHHAFSVVPENHTTTNNRVFSGPFVLEERTSAFIRFVKNENYWDSAAVALPSIKIEFSDDPDENAYAFNNGFAHWIPGDFYIVNIYDTKSIVMSPQFSTEFLFFLADKEPWNNKTLRNALIAAIPWEELRENSIVIATTLLLPLDGYPEVYGLMEQDLDIALELLEEAGYTTDNDLELVFAIPDVERCRKQSEIIGKALEQLGITLKIESTANQRYLNSLTGWEADLFTYTWIGDFADPLAFLELFRKESSLKVTQWENSEFEALLNTASELTDANKRYEKLGEAEQLLLDEGIILPISHPVSLHAVDYTLRGWYSNGLDLHPFKNMYFGKNADNPGFVYFDQNQNLCYYD